MTFLTIFSKFGQNQQLQAEMKRLFIDIEKMIVAAMRILVNVSIFDTAK